MISIMRKRIAENETSDNKFFIVTPYMIETFITFTERGDLNYILKQEEIEPGIIKQCALRQLYAVRRGDFSFIRDFNRLIYVVYALKTHMFKREQIVSALVFAIANAKYVSSAMCQSFNCFVFMLLCAAQQYKRDNNKENITPRDIEILYKKTLSKRRQNTLGNLFSGEYTYKYACEVFRRDTIDEFIALHNAFKLANELK